MTTVITIIADHLRSIGADGLVYPGECGCELSDLAPCAGRIDECQPGYKGAVKPDDDPADERAMYPSREAADASKTRGAA